MRKSRDYRRLLWRRLRSVNSQCFIISSRTWARPLTEGEIALASLLLRDAIDYSRVRIHARRYMPFQPKNCCMTSNGSMYFHHSCFLDDYSQAHLTGQHWFMHEMVLLWQFAHQTLARRGAATGNRNHLCAVAGAVTHLWRCRPCSVNTSAVRIPEPKNA